MVSFELYVGLRRNRTQDYSQRLTEYVENIIHMCNRMLSRLNVNVHHKSSFACAYKRGVAGPNEIQNGG